MTNSRTRSRLIMRLAAVTLLSIAAVLACRFSPGSQGTAEPQGFLPLTEMASITPPPPPRQACPITQGEPATPTWSEPSLAARPLLNYLNAGGATAELSAPADQSLAWVRPDLDGDGLVDLVALVSRQGQSITNPGTMLVFHCQQDQFELVYSAASNPELSAPKVLNHQDLNADGGEDLLVSRQRCGAHTCSEQLEFLTMSSGQLTNRLQGSTEDLPSPKVEVINLADGPDRIQVTATGINSVGAGPFRPYTRVWTWDEADKLYRPTEEYQAQTEYRIHHLHDADQAASQGNYNQAINGYQRVIQDDSLADWMEPERERRILSAYARFRLLTTAVQTGDLTAAETWFGRTQSEVEPDSAGAPFANLAERFWMTYQQTDDYDQACQSARAFAAAQREDVLDPLYFGYSNPTYTPDDICPMDND